MRDKAIQDKMADLILQIHKSKPGATIHLGRKNFSGLLEWLGEQNRVFQRDGNALIIAGRRVVEKL